MTMLKGNFTSALTEELTDRGYENCYAINNAWLPPSVTYKDTFGCQYSVIYADDDEQPHITIMVNHICEGDESELSQQMVICNHFNSESRYARFYCNDSGGILVRADISCTTENLISVCADIFEIVSEKVAELVEYLDSE